ncbi:hypothetical protein AB0958_28385 [Streptomyces sp. NPDC006655]|uniref:hypothetical protein n=1 Tax=Streptomyces sp. NPDC006655 TaxID=3156898 RepID=UPI003451C0B9
MTAALGQPHQFTGVGGARGLLIDALGGAVNDRPAVATAFPGLRRAVALAMAWVAAGRDGRCLLV